MGALKNVSSRDKILLVVLVFIGVFTGIYFLHTSVSEKGESLKSANGSLEQQRLVMSSTISKIKDSEKKLETKVKDTEDYYNQFSDNYDTPKEFERVFLGWLNGRDISVNSFAYSEPVSLDLVYDEKEEVLHPMKENALLIDGEEVVKVGEDGKPQVDDTYKPEDDPAVIQDGDVDEDEKPAEPVVPDVSKEDKEVYSVLKSSYVYSLTLSKYEYTRLVDLINEYSKFIYLESSSFAEPDGQAPIGNFAITVYSYDKPEMFEQAEDNSYFKYRTNGAILYIDAPEEDKTTIIPVRPGGSTGNNDSNEDVKVDSNGLTIFDKNHKDK